MFFLSKVAANKKLLQTMLIFCDRSPAAAVVQLRIRVVVDSVSSDAIGICTTAGRGGGASYIRSFHRQPRTFVRDITPFNYTWIAYHGQHLGDMLSSTGTFLLRG